MRRLLNARRRGLALREKLDPKGDLQPAELLDRLVGYLWSEHKIEPEPVDPLKLQDGRAEVKRPSLFYNRNLAEGSVALLRVMAHETGHVILHDRLRRLDAEPDATKAGTYTANERVPGVARYSPAMREEAEADAFALEFVCPAGTAIGLWEREGLDSREVASRLGVQLGVARAQLAEGLYRLVAGVPLDAPDVDPWRPDLDDDQEPAALHDDTSREDARERDVTDRRPALVVAGPGCGKTTTLAARAVWAIRTDSERDAITPEDAASHVLALTFSNEAAAEFSARISAGCAGAGLSSGVAEKVSTMTFHGFCRLLLYKHGHHLTPPVGELAPVLDEAAQEELLLASLGEAQADVILDLKDLRGTASELRRHIDHLKQRLDPDGAPWTPEALADHLDSLRNGVSPGSLDEADALLSVFRVYEARKADLGALDFSDLVGLALRLLRAAPRVRSAYRQQYRHVLVDEFQDVSRAVSGVLAEVCGPENPPWVVGDPNQAVYRFLNASPENVTAFGDDFEGAEVYRLRHNYRSTAAVVDAANELAELLGETNGTSGATLVAAADVDPLHGGPTVQISAAESDRAEYEGVARQVQQWNKRGAALHDIAVLCRRNADVRDVLLALGQRGVRAVAAGVLTPEGAAGDLAVIATLHDGGGAARRAGLARLAYALGRFNDPESIDPAIRRLFELVTQEGSVDSPSDDDDPLVRTVVDAARTLERERYRGDAFDMMASFLFDVDGYLRPLLAARVGTDAADSTRATGQLNEAVAALRLGESLTALSQAAAYRISRGRASEETPEDEAARRRRSRALFAEHLRRRLFDATPTARTPERVEDAVQVMTCHAAKGLEFDCVCVVGQTKPDFRGRGGLPWLPPSLSVPSTEDDEQADAVLFVGVTRARRALCVSYAEAAKAGSRRRRALVPLLARWIESSGRAVDRWEEEDSESAAPGPFQALWGGRPRVRFDPRDLDGRACGLDAYIRRVAGARLPEGQRAVYPRFVDAVRAAVRRCVASAHEAGRPLTAAEALAHFDTVWRSVEVDLEDHPHLELFGRLGRRTAGAFATAYDAPRATMHRSLGLQGLAETEHEGVTLPLGLASAFVGEDGRPVAILVRTESYAGKLSSDGSGVLWSKMSSARRLPFVLLRRRHPDLVPLVFSVADGALYPFKWGPDKSVAKAEADAVAALSRLADGEYGVAASDFVCGRCGSRTVCPHWLAEN